MPRQGGLLVTQNNYREMIEPEVRTFVQASELLAYYLSSDVNFGKIYGPTDKRTVRYKTLVH